VITLGHLVVSVCLDCCVSTCVCCGLAVDIVSSLIMAAVCGDNV